MNKRILELADQAAEGMAGLAIPDEYCKKFAELIVKECMKVAVFKDSGYMHPADVAGYMAAGRSTAAQMIREHFGVEE
jgi:hypothetical protein